VKVNVIYGISLHDISVPVGPGTLSPAWKRCIDLGLGPNGRLDTIVISEILSQTRTWVGSIHGLCCVGLSMGKCGQISV